MIVTEIFTNEIDHRELKKTYSNENYYIRQIQTSAIYAEAIDVLTSTYTYEETNQKIVNLEEEI